MRRASKWTWIYWGGVTGLQGIYPFIRLVPNFMDTEAACFPHGIELGHTHFATEEDATKAADTYDTFFDAMFDAVKRSRSIVNDHDSPLSANDVQPGKWTKIYHETVNGLPGTHPFIRLTPNFMNLEAAGFPVGIGLGHSHFDSEEVAHRVASMYDKFLDAMLDEINDEIAEQEQGES